MGPDQHGVYGNAGAHAGAEVRIVHNTTEATGQTAGMLRLAAISKDSVGASKVWFGKVTCPPGLNSGPHHHAEAETAGYMVSGHRIRIYFGENYEKSVDVEPGDFLFVPAWMPHIEVNLSDEVPAEFITARAPDNIVINLEDDKTPEHLSK
jgi:uncharacterized RmlC-like cupin family protein